MSNTPTYFMKTLLFNDISINNTCWWITTSTNMKTHKPILWQPHSWQKKIHGQEIPYPLPAKAVYVQEYLSKLPPLVEPQGINTLKSQLAEAARGERFLLQGGDCAEHFSDCNLEAVRNKVNTLLQMSQILSEGLKKPVICVGRIAGQYAKPRSELMETQEDKTLPSYRGDLINKPGFSVEERTPDPDLMLEAYNFSAQTLSYIHDERFFTSHEALHLPYEEPLTRWEADEGVWYNRSTHFPWLGMRTADIDGAHVEYLRGIANPIAIKVGPSMAPESLVKLLEVLNPHNEPGRISLIHRLGTKEIAAALPRLIKSVNNSGHDVLWSCDPMHGNTAFTCQGIKTRYFEDILSELSQAFTIHAEMGTCLGGVHFELTGDDVTECIGGSLGITEADLSRAYKTLMDPRLNYIQALEMVTLIAKGYS